MSTPAFLSARRIECERAFQRFGETIAQNARDKCRFVSAWFGSFMARVVRVQKLAELNDFSLDSMERVPTKVEEEDIIETAVTRICESQEDPSLETLRMQLGFESVYDTELRRIQSNRARKEAEKDKQIDKIVQLGLDLQTTEQVATLYRQIFRLLIANGGVETVDRLVEREIAAALESVFPQAGLNAFNVLPKEEKRKQITDMISIILGIRLFNKHIRKGGAGLTDVPSVLPGALEDLHRQLDGEAVQETDVSTQYANLLDLEYERPGTISGSVKRLQTEYTNRRQYVLFVHQLRHETLEAAQAVNSTTEQLNALLSQLKDVVGTKTSIPKDQVYPKFHTVAELWGALVMQQEALKVRRIVFDELLRFKNSFTRSIIPSDVALLDSWAPASTEIKGAGSFEFVGDWKADDSSNPSDIARLTAESFPGFLSLALQYQGYCPWALFKRQGMLLPGNPNLGILQVKSKGQHFSFSSVEAMKQFCESPQRYIEGVKRTAVKYPELIHLLSLQDEFSLCSIPALLDFMNIDSSSPGPQMMINGSNKVDQDCQTPVHIVESNIDPNYQWNEWTLRKQAIQLANITNKSTHSSQTDESHFRRENDAQCYVKGMLADGTMPGVGAQTGVEKGTQIEQTSRYFAGLRGHPQSKMSVINLTLDSKVTEGSNNNFPNFKGTSATITVPSQSKQAK